jgi:hypothetical protein
MRDLITSLVDWPETIRDQPAWRAWRERLWVQDPSGLGPLYSTCPREQICRTMRGFVIYKGKHRPVG